LAGTAVRRECCLLPIDAKILRRQLDESLYFRIERESDSIQAPATHSDAATILHDDTLNIAYSQAKSDLIAYLV
jgi:hypothetical protein